MIATLGLRPRAPARFGSTSNVMQLAGELTITALPRFVR
jgi:hypothetical protein